MKTKKTCLSCKYREFDCYGWYCSKHNIYNDFYDKNYIEMRSNKCKYHKRDSRFILSNGIHKCIVINGKTYSYKQGKFILIKNYLSYEECI